MLFVGSSPVSIGFLPFGIYRIYAEKLALKMPKSLDLSRLFVWASFLVPSYGWDSRTRTCKARVKVSCVAVTPYPIGIVRTPGKGAFVRSFGIITQRGFLVNIPDSHSGGRRSGQGYRTRGQYPRRENGCGGGVRFAGYLRRVRLGLMCAISGQCEQRGG